MQDPVGTTSHKAEARAASPFDAGGSHAVVSANGHNGGGRNGHAAPELARREKGSAGVEARALVIGTGAVARRLALSLETRGRRLVVGMLDADPLRERCGDWPVLGPPEDAAALAEEHEIDEIYVACPPSWQQRMVDDLARSRPGTRVLVTPAPYEAMMRHTAVGTRADVALVPLGAGAGRWTRRLKRACDLAVAGAVLGLGSPAWLLIGLLIKVSSPGGAMFTQERVGLQGRPFLVYKFRTMRHNAEALSGPVLAEGWHDSRMTRAGKWLRRYRIDEIPQFINVLRGEMSLVGPRPERPCFVEEYIRQQPTYARRHDVLPGITGLAQVMGGYHTDGRDKLRFDLIYAANQSVWLDIRILLMTVRAVLTPERQ